MFVTFSGLDGAGKTTHITLTERYLASKNHQVKVLRMYDNVSCSAFLRKLIKRITKKKADGASTHPGSPNRSFRMDKNRKELMVVFLRQIAYLVDLVISWLLRAYYEKLRGYILIFDRYLFDSLANLANTNVIADYYSKTVLRVIPEPDIAILLDVDAKTAFFRKPEYPLEYNDERRNAYLRLFNKIKVAVIIRSEGIKYTQKRIEESLSRIMLN